MPDQVPIKCPNWPLQAVVIRYDLGCPDGFNCRLCHGWKEFEYHPSRIKTVDCRRCESPSSAPDSLHNITRHICCFRHPWDKINPPNFDINLFYLVPKRKPLGPRTTRQYLSYIMATVPALPASPLRSPDTLVDFLSLAPRDILSPNARSVEQVGVSAQPAPSSHSLSYNQSFSDD